jgi:hypothetical protein
VTRTPVEHTAVRLALVVWVALAVVSAAATQGETRLTLRVALVAAAGILVAEGARWLSAHHGPEPEPWLPLVRRVRPRPAGRPPALQSWIDLFEAAERDAAVGPLLRDRLRDLAVHEPAPVDAIVAELEER